MLASCQSVTSPLRAIWGPLPLPALARHRRVLLVEDHPEVGQCMARLLAMSGHEVRLAYTARAALRLASEFDPQIVFLDLGLPVMDGLEVARRIRRMATPTRPTIVALTGHAGSEHRRRTIEAGFDYHLVKPVDIDVLDSLIETV